MIKFYLNESLFMKTTSIKKIIAKEGLILLLFISIATFGLFANLSLLSAAFFPGYFLYWICRFIYWALRTLEIIKPKENPDDEALY